MRKIITRFLQAFIGWYDENTQIFLKFIFPITLLSILLSVFLLVDPFLNQRNYPGMIRESGADSPNVILIIADALTAEDMSLFGYPLQTTPALEQISSDWTVYNNAQSPLTCSVAMLPTVTTGRYPYTNDYESYGDNSNSKDGWVNLGQVLRNNSYDTWWVGHNSPGYYHLGPGYNKNLCSTSSMHEILYRSRFQFEGIINPTNPKLKYYTPWTLGYLENLKTKEMHRCGRLEKVAQLLTDWDLQGKLDHPFFLYFHERGVHYPYWSGKFMGTFLPVDEGLEAREDMDPFYGRYEPEDQEMVDKLRLRYNEIVLYHDSTLGTFIQYLKDENLYDSSMIIITADHGQNFDNGYSSHCTPLVAYSETHVPLLIKYPDQTEGRLVDTLVSTIDLAPTILDVAGIGYSEDWFDGKSLLQLENEPDTDRIIVSRRLTHTKELLSFFAATDGQYRYIRRVEKGKENEYLFDIQKDPAEKQNLLIEMDGSSQVERLRQAVDEYRNRNLALDQGRNILVP